jgi:hypothetical protein
MGLLRTILIIIIVYYGLRIIAKYILPIVLRQAVNKVQNNMRDQFEQQEKTNRSVGETSVDYAPKNDSSSKEVGEYIEFEEVDEGKSKKN